MLSFKDNRISQSALLWWCSSVEWLQHFQTGKEYEHGVEEGRGWPVR